MSFVLGLTGPLSYDQAAVLVEDGRIIAAAEEERFTGVKHQRYGPPMQAAGFCLEYAGIKPGELDSVAIGWGSKTDFFSSNARLMLRSPYMALNLPSYIADVRRYWGLGFLEGFRGRVSYHRHHVAHMASAFYCSGFQKANIITIDESGEAESTVLGVGDGEEIERIMSFDYVDSLGRLYRQYTEYLGFIGNCDEYKVMGLAAYGKGHLDTSHLLRITSRGYTLRTPHLAMSLLRTLARKIGSVLAPYGRKLDLEDYLRHGQQRRPDEPITAAHQDVAATIQGLYERVLIHLAQIQHEQTGHRKFCIAGGCGLNCSANGKLLAQDFVEDIFVQPASSDAGSALGAALLQSSFSGKSAARLNDVSLGPGYDNEHIEAELKRSGLPYEPCGDVASYAARLLSEDKIVGWFQGRMEFGPRALGNRSILANPGIEKNRDMMNLLKGREMWRPLAPSMLEEDVASYFSIAHLNRFMTVTQPVVEERLKSICAAAHVDGTTRYQSVPSDQGRYRRLLEEMGALTGVACALNTSFNPRGMPIVMSPADAISAARDMGLQHLAIGDFIMDTTQ